jgi:integrase
VKTSSELSNMQCEKAVPRPKPYRIADSGGLNLLVMPSGGKLWRWNYHFEGKQKTMAYGKYPDVSLAKVRVLHAAARATLAAGVDPMAERKKAKEEKLAELARKEKVEADAITFEDLARKWFAWWKADKNPKYVRNVERRLEHDVINKIGKRKAEDIKRMDIVALSQAVDGRGARDIARRNLQFICQIYIHSNNLGLVEGNPAYGIKPNDILSKTVVKHFAHLEIKEIPLLLRKMNDYSGNAMTRIAMELLALTFLRTSELIGGRWEEIDWEAKQWNIPGPRMKKKRPHIVPLATQSIAALKRLYAITGKSDRMFPCATGGLGVMSNNTILKALENMGYKGVMTGHGWRTVASTFLNERGFDGKHVEMQLSHMPLNQVAGIYNRALYIEPRTTMMQFWADFIDKCRESGV